MSNVILSQETEDRIRETLKNQRASSSQAGIVWQRRDVPLAEARTVFDGTSMFEPAGPITGSAYVFVSFDSHEPNEETAAAIREARAGIGLIKTSSREDLFKKLNDE